MFKSCKHSASVSRRIPEWCQAPFWDAALLQKVPGAEGTAEVAAKESRKSGHFSQIGNPNYQADPIKARSAALNTIALRSLHEAVGTAETFSHDGWIENPKSELRLPIYDGFSKHRNASVGE